MSNSSEVQEGNKIIAEFLGWQFLPIDGSDVMEVVRNDEVVFREHERNIEKFLLDGLNYHLDWNKLMPVVEKIRNDHFVNIEMYGDFVAVYITKDKDLPIPKRNLYSENKNALYAIYDAVIQFLQWYNTQTKSTD